METLESLPSFENGSVLDVGTGTGILSLSALGLGARQAAAFDIDGDAVRTCRRNSEINGMGERLKVYQGTLDALALSLRFDLVMANLHGDIILKEADRLAGHTGEGGHMILSGLDYTDSTPVRNVMSENGMEEISVTFLDDYVTQLWRRPPARARKEP